MSNSNSSNLEKADLLRALVAVTKGDLSARLPIGLEGMDGKIADAFNLMVEQSAKVSAEIERVSRTVGGEGKIAQRAYPNGLEGAWFDIIGQVNSLVDDLVWPTSEIARVIGGVARGDLGQTMGLEAQGRSLKGEFLQTARTVNTMVEQLNAFAFEVVRVAREVGTEGKLGGQAQVKGLSGTWKDLSDNVNLMASNLTDQMRNIAAVTTAVAQGDLSKKITVDVRGEFLLLKDTINTMVDQLRSFGSEVTRVAREVGTEGKLGGQAVVPGIAGVWKDLTDNVNLMANNLTGQVRNIAAVTTAVAGGDLSKKITVDVRGEIAELKDMINTMVDQLNAFAAEVTRVAREVGTEGRLGGQADVKGVSGVWKDLTDNVNQLAANLTGQVRNIAEVTTAVANGDLSKKITVDVEGEIKELKTTINIMVDQLQGFAGEVTRVAREVGTEGQLGGQAEVRGVSGVWKDLTDSVNRMATNLTDQVRAIAGVTTAVANGDLSKKITVNARGEIMELKGTINTMVDQFQGFAAEVTRVAREVGTEGKLGGQAQVPGVAGVWKDLTDNVNLMAANLTGQVRNIAEVTTAVANGDLSKKITVDVKGEILELKATMNTMVDQLRAFAAEVTRVAREVGTEGRLGGQAQVSGVAGTWKDLTDSVNFMASNLTSQVRNIATVTTAVAYGDLSKKITVDVKGEILELKNTINTMVDQLNAFASEVTRVAREVGTDGKLGGQAKVTGVAGIWSDLTDNVNLMAANLTDQVRGIAKVVTAVANGNLKQRLTFQAKGEIASLADTINSMTDTVATFSDQVTSVAREVGVEGRLGGQALVPGASGTWKDLVDNVNRLAANLTTQVRAIAEVVTAVTKGDLTRFIQVLALGEVAELKDLINEMIRNLRETTQRNAEQDWLKTNLARFTRILQGERDMATVARTLLAELAPVVSAHHGVFYALDHDSGHLKMLSNYGYRERKNLATEFAVGEGLVGTAAFEKQRILLTNVPADYVQITSGLGEATPLNIIVLPILFEGEVKAVTELASFERFSPIHQNFLEQLSEGIGIVLNTIEASTRTEELLKQSQALAQELKSGQYELQQTNEELEEKARLLAQQNAEVERKNQEIEETRRAIEEKAEQLALTSKYKSEFLANMSHELRTPLNSLLLLAEQLEENPEGNLSPKQLTFANTIHGAGRDLLNLINDILDLSKIESGTVNLDVEELTIGMLCDRVESTFRHVAEAKSLGFGLQRGQRLPPHLITDGKRLMQVLKNLLSNAFKFTQHGEVVLDIQQVTEGWSRDHEVLNRSFLVVAFAVRDSGIGIPTDRQKIVFEAFQQADASTSRKYGGAGLGLAISRDIAALLGGELRLTSSDPGSGSVFTLYIPQTYSGPAVAPGLSLSAPATAFLNPVRRVEGQEHASSEDSRPLLLIVEDEPSFALRVLQMANENGFRGVVAANGAQALSLARELRPDAITLDVNLPDIDGWQLLGQLKVEPNTRGIPIHVISACEENPQERGAIAHLLKPVSPGDLRESMSRLARQVGASISRLLVVEDVAEERQQLVDMLSAEEVSVKSVASGQEALEAMHNERFDCVILDLNLPDISGFEVLQKMAADSRFKNIPVVVYTARDLSRRDLNKLEKLARTVVVKGDDSVERLLAETSLFLHRVNSDLPQAGLRLRQHSADDGTEQQRYHNEVVLEGRKLLIVDDDARNLFALTSLLERRKMEVVTAESGQEAIDLLLSASGVEIVLMDIMLPEMDGYDTIREIRKHSHLRELPIIALTAKAMKGDREKCLEAGASDYVAKPVNVEQLLSLLRVWLHR